MSLSPRSPLAAAVAVLKKPSLRATAVAGLAAVAVLGAHRTVGAQVAGAPINPIPSSGPSLIQCVQSGSFAQPGPSSFLFTAQDCGGTLPDVSYVGLATQFQVDGGLSSFAVLGATFGGPGFSFTATAPSGGYSVVATFIQGNVGGGPNPIGGSAGPGQIAGGGTVPSVGAARRAR